MKTKLFLLCILTVFICGTVFADTIELVNGQKIEGTLVGRSGDKVQFEVNGIVSTYNASDVTNITIGSTSPPPAKQAEQPAPTPPPTTSASISLPAGTILMVRTQQALDTKKQGAGHKFIATLEGDLVSGGTVVAPRGSSVYGQINESNQAGRLTGKSEMTIIFTGLMINNQIIPIRSGEIKAVNSSSSGQSTVGRTARTTAIGGLIGGSDGAKTGAKVGLGVSILTRGDSLNIPAGTLLEVPLAETLAF